MRNATGGQKLLAVFVAPMLAVMAISLSLPLFGVEPGAAQLISRTGCLLVVLGAFAYAVFVDSKGRWPGVSAWQRYVRVVTFYRGR